MRDFSEYLSLPGKLDIEESNWQANPHLHIRQAKVVNDVCEKYGLNAIIEIGCSTGNLFQHLDNKDYYAGYDLNKAALSLARQKFARHDYKFFHVDIRDLPILGKPNADLVCCFAFLKHFGLHEWDEIFHKCASLGEYFVFDMQIADETKDDGIDFHHVWKSIDGLHKSIHDAGLVLLQTIYEGDTIAPIFVCKRRSPIIVKIDSVETKDFKSDGRSITFNSSDYAKKD